MKNIYEKLYENNNEKAEGQVKKRLVQKVSECEVALERHKYNEFRWHSCEILQECLETAIGPKCGRQIIVLCYLTMISLNHCPSISNGY